MGPGQPGPGGGRVFLPLARIQGCPAAGRTSSPGRSRGRTDGVVWRYVPAGSDPLPGASDRCGHDRQPGADPTKPL